MQQLYVFAASPLNADTVYVIAASLHEALAHLSSPSSNEAISKIERLGPAQLATPSEKPPSSGPQ